MITSRLDYCNVLYHNLRLSEVSKLQSLQNAAARLVTRTRKFDHITPVLKDLHWLPVVKRVEFKVLLTIFKIIHGQAPAYLSELISVKISHVNTRFSVGTSLVYPARRSKNKFYGSRIFSQYAPIMWNGLPGTIRQIDELDSFKRAIKTHLFKSYYEL